MWHSIPSSDNWRPICSTSDVSMNRRNIYHHPVLLWRSEIPAPWCRSALTYLLTREEVQQFSVSREYIKVWPSVSVTSAKLRPQVWSVQGLDRQSQLSLAFVLVTTVNFSLTLLYQTKHTIFAVVIIRTKIHVLVGASFRYLNHRRKETSTHTLICRRPWYHQTVQPADLPASSSYYCY